MKKIVLTLAVCALMATGVYAQGLSGGIKAGLNISNQKYSADGISISPDSKIGFQVGGYLTAMLSENFGIQPELLYSGMGAKFDEDALKLGYISVPVMLRYNVSEIISIHAGPQVGFLLSAKAEDEDVKDGMETIDFGAAFGLGADFGKINAGARYYLGFSNTAKDSGDLTVKNNAIQLYVGLKLFGE